MGSPLTLTDLYDILDNHQLNTLIMKIMREKDGLVSRRIQEAYVPMPYRHNHFIIIRGTDLILLRVGIDYWYDGSELLYKIEEAVRFACRKDYDFYLALYDYADTKLLPQHKLN
jgi:hypothetical protein